MYSVWIRTITKQIIQIPQIYRQPNIHTNRSYPQMNLTNEETNLLKDFLDKLSDHFSNADYDDYDLPNTQENKDLLINAIYYSDDSTKEEMEYDIERVNNAKGKKLHTTNSLLLSYLQYKLLGDK